MAPLHGWTEREGDEQQRSEWVEKKKKGWGKGAGHFGEALNFDGYKTAGVLKRWLIFKLCTYTWNKVAINKEYKRSQGPMKSPA